MKIDELISLNAEHRLNIKILKSEIASRDIELIKAAKKLKEANKLKNIYLITLNILINGYKK